MTRRTFSLNGLWDFCPVYNTNHDLSLPENPVYEQEKIIIPSNWREVFSYKDFAPFSINEYKEKWKNALTGLCRTFFTVNFSTNERVFLKINNVSQVAAVYINHKHLTDWNEIYLPLIIDITDEILAGRTNELSVVCTSFETHKISSGAKRITDLAGSWYGNLSRGVWGDVSLIVLPKIHIKDVTIRTSVRKKNIEIISELSTEFNGKIKAEIYDSNNTVMKFECIEGSTVRTFENPVLWDTENPHLYNLRMTLESNDEVIDEITERFGFREFWNQGSQFMLNGVPINLRGDSWHFQGVIQNTKEYAENWFDICKQNGLNSVRLHAEPHPVCYLEAADEKGILIIDETAIYGSGKSMDASSIRYIDNCKQHIKRLIKRDKNHASVVLWSLQNEMRWVDGRDTYKKYIPEMISIMNKLDPTRQVSLDGDNRLLSYENTQIESLHYNIDGTIAQWKREKPLTIGEHGGMWYLCPQNGSAYTGLQAYNDFESAAVSFAIKEKLFVESARREEVSGISTFNFAYYYTYSMPDKDVYVKNAPFKKIPKYSLSINNGMLKDYPVNRPNPLASIMKSCFLPVTMINREYDKSFYDNTKVIRTFDVYNDTLKVHNCTIQYKWSANNRDIKKGEFNYKQNPAEHYIWRTEIPALKVDEKTQVMLNVILLHDNKRVIEKQFIYNIYPTNIKKSKINISRKAAYYGSDNFYYCLSGLIDCDKITDFSEIMKYNMLVVGPYISNSQYDLQSTLERFVSSGGVLIVLEQNNFSLGNLQLQKQSFFSAHSGMKNHPILKGLEDEDFIFWKPNITEGEPQPIIMQNFKKPLSGGYRFILESDYGDYADGGDLWSPLMGIKYKTGLVIMSQLEIADNFGSVPQSCVLLRNMLDYCGNLQSISYKKVNSLGKKARQFIDNNRIIESINPDILFCDVENEDISKLKNYIFDGGIVVTLPFNEIGAKKLSYELDCKIDVKKSPVCHLLKVGNNVITDGISPVDLFHYDKVPMSPRQTENTIAAVYSINCENACTLITDSPNTPWDDYFGKGNSSEYCRIPIVCMNNELRNKSSAYLSVLKIGNGIIYLNQLCCDINNEKDMRTYRNMFEGLGAEIETNLFSYYKKTCNYALDYFMTLPVEDWQNCDDVRSYYTDPLFSLNNLGEGLYGWMLKVEKNDETGYITIPSSKKRKYFLTCFVDKSGESKKVIANINSNAEIKLYVNGERQEFDNIVLKNGVNRIVIEADNQTDDNLKLLFVITDMDKKPINDIRAHLTINEVDPK